MKKYRRAQDVKLETNATVLDRLARRKLSCSFCKPNRAENAKRHGKHGARPPRRKNRTRP